MKNLLLVAICITMLISCLSNNEADKYPVKQNDWSEKQIELKSIDSLIKGQTYLPIYSHIYHIFDQRTFDLTATVSIRNVSPTDSLFLIKADYYNTNGKKIRSYTENPVYIKPLETIEIVINEKDYDGGSGAKFLFDWAKTKSIDKPLFEAVMVSSYGQQGLSFTTQGVHLEKN